ncbi:fibrobacter succinogenes major paralogous domain-containing protein [Elizabethkingia ursingii]|uniref:FISUMP domain-containing protein n=1 Tax=Elizabethkingia ursingii TaxID=1756150 RepID=UPI0012FF5892|nr:FISUMP domain-containing protein [Elizabethkingia ursingii]
MNIEMNIVQGIAVVAFLGMTSCRSTDTDNTLKSTGISSVNVNLLGTDYSNSGSNASVASTKSNVSDASNEIQRHQEMLTPSSFIEAELVPISSITNKQAFIGNNVVTTSGSTLGSGVKFRVIAYQQNNGAYKDYKDYTIGQHGASLILDRNEAYYLVLYSWGTNTLPTITNGELTNISNAAITYNNISRDFTYQKVVYITTNEKGTVSTILRHKMSEITVTLNSFGGEMTSISNAILGPHYTSGNISLSSGNISRTSNSSNIGLSFPSGASISKTATPIIINADTGSSNTGFFSANITLGGTTKAISLGNAFKINPEKQQKLNINIKRCGAYLGPNQTNWKEFDCFNLGTDKTKDPFTISSSIYGSKYQWGNNSPVLSQASDQSNPGVFSNWPTAATSGMSWSSNPCPSGYRVPTKNEWELVQSNNALTRIGTWTTSLGDNFNFGAALKIGSSLLLPVAGWRDYNAGALQGMASRADYWSSDRYDSTYAYYFVSDYANLSYSPLLYYVVTSAMAVRCIAQ